MTCVYDVCSAYHMIQMIHMLCIVESLYYIYIYNTNFGLTAFLSMRQTVQLHGAFLSESHKTVYRLPPSEFRVQHLHNASHLRHVDILHIPSGAQLTWHVSGQVPLVYELAGMFPGLFQDSERRAETRIIIVAWPA